MWQRTVECHAKSIPVPSIHSVTPDTADYCCNRASAVVGYTNVAHYSESKRGWMEAGLPVEKAAQRILSKTESAFGAAKKLLSHPLRNAT